MDKEHLKKYEKLLLARKEEQVAIIEAIGDQTFAAPMQEELSELSSYDNHPADIGTEVFERSKDLGLRNEAADNLKDIESALKRIEDNNYGKCEVCGKEIDQRRLEILPEAALCIACQEIYEEERPKLTHTIEEDIIQYSFHKLLKDEENPVERVIEDEVTFDGVDIWQEVNRYGSSNTPSDVPNDSGYVNLYEDREDDPPTVEKMDNIRYTKDKNGMFYESNR